MNHRAERLVGMQVSKRTGIVTRTIVSQKKKKVNKVWNS